MKNLKQIKAIEAANKSKLKTLYPYLTDSAGIYVLTRAEDGFKYAYVGQSKHMLTRLAEHLQGYTQHIDRSLKKHGLKVGDNVYGWELFIARECLIDQLDRLEREYILNMHKRGYQLLNETTGGQDGGKKAISTGTRKGYREGVAAGYEKARKEIKHLFDKHLNAVIKSGKGNKMQEKALQKFKDFLK